MKRLLIVMVDAGMQHGSSEEDASTNRGFAQDMYPSVRPLLGLLLLTQAQRLLAAKDLVRYNTPSTKFSATVIHAVCRSNEYCFGWD